MSKGRILIVEDESIVALDIRETLENCGFSVVACVVSGEEAVMIATREQPDLILMDIRLAGEIDGLEAARRIQQHMWIPTVFLTAFGEQDLVEQAKDVDAFGFILKPFVEKDLGVNLDMALNRARSERKLRQALTPEQQVDSRAQNDARYYLRTFGGLQLQTRGQVVMHGEQLSKTQRKLIALLLIAPQNRLPLEEVQATLWPTSTAEKARSSFDSLMLRTRKVFVGVAGSAESLIVVKRGVLILESCQVDIADFSALYQEGLTYCRRNALVDAEKVLLAALELTRGPFLPLLKNFVPVAQYREELSAAINGCYQRLGDVYAARGDIRSAIEYVARAAAALPADEEILSRLARLCQKGDEPARLKTALKNYRAARLSEGHQKAAVDEMVADLVTQSVQ